jgi:hypothetical protein
MQLYQTSHLNIRYDTKTNRVGKKRLDERGFHLTKIGTRVKNTCINVDIVGMAGQGK